MDVRLKITGGVAGPAGWQDISAKLAGVGVGRIQDVESALDGARSSKAVVSPVFPDALTYEFWYGDAPLKYLKTTDADMSSELHEIVNLIKEHGAVLENGKRESQKEEGTF